LEATGDAVVLKTLMSMTDEPTPSFAIVTP
jgi:alkyl sulfatase BDS1-like metallo-beta-lactamase superfamily hydrolase